MKGVKAFASHRDGEDRICRGTNKSELLHKLLRKYIPETVSLALTDMILVLFIMEYNHGNMVNYCTLWSPEMRHVSARSLPYLLNINRLSTMFKINSPVEKIPFINAISEGIFGWAGSTGFYEAASIGKQLKTAKPLEISDNAALMVLAEIQDSASQSTTFDTLILAVENRRQASTPTTCDRCPQPPSSLPSSSSSLTSSVLPPLCNECTHLSETALKSADTSEQKTIVFQSPGMNRNKKQRKESNKGSSGSHQAASGKLQLTTKKLVNEHPTAQRFLYQHGDLSLFSGNTAIERRYIRWLVLGMTGCDNIADVDVKTVNKAYLWKVFFFLMYVISSVE
jgi:hypothetical protein